METEIFKELYSRDLTKLELEISQYANEESIWHIEKAISNSAGNLCLHLIGNLNTYIGKELGGIEYIRDRPLEFSQKGVPKETLISRIKETHKIVMDTFDRLNPASLSTEYPVLLAEGMKSTRHTLIHLAMHLSYHLGQINYHRRLLDGSPLAQNA
jgi:hypothetical protein